MDSLEKNLDEFLNNLVKKSKHFKNAILAVSKGDGDFDWFGARGIANHETKAIVTPNTPYFIASITKLFTATIIMRLLEEKKLKLEAKIVSYLDKAIVNGIHNFKGIDHTDSITINHLLSHTSGIADYYLEKPKDDNNYMDMVLENPENEVTVDQTIQIARERLTPNFIPGTKAKYSDTNFQLLGKIIEGIEKKELHEVYIDRIFGPLNLKNTWLYRKSEPIEKIEEPVAEFYYNDKIISNSKPFYAAWADGGLISTTKDCLYFLKTLFAGEIISKETLSLMHNWKSIGFPLKYGLGTMNIDFPAAMTMFRKLPPLVGHLGSTGAFLLYVEDWDLFLAGTVNQSNSPMHSVRVPLQLLNKIRKQVFK